MTDTKESNNNVTGLVGTYEWAVNEVRKKKPTRAIILYAINSEEDDGEEAIGIQFTSGVAFPEWASFLLSLDIFIKSEYGRR